jgi:hypothetical protein
MAGFTVMATLTHLEAVAALLRQAAEAAPGPFHERRLRRLASGFESLTEPIQRIASGLDETAVQISQLEPPAEDSPQVREDAIEGFADPEEGH